MMEFIYVQTEDMALLMGWPGVMGEGMVTSQQQDSAAGDFSRVTAIWERHLPFKTSQGLCLTELPGQQQGQPPACQDGIEMLLNPTSTVSPPSMYRHILKPNYASAAPVGLTAEHLMSFMRPVFHGGKMKTLKNLE